MTKKQWDEEVARAKRIEEYKRGTAMSDNRREDLILASVAHTRAIDREEEVAAHEKEKTSKLRREELDKARANVERTLEALVKVACTMSGCTYESFKGLFSEIGKDKK